ncbi:MAG: helix-turn-helix domain-containing protein [Planctomycetes bacterium]|nr:helix-turn-helix domain-containing protein [Planctomycetota bacterium]
MAGKPANAGGTAGSGHLTVSEAARDAGVNYNTIKKWIEKGLLPATVQRPDNHLWIKESDLQRAIEGSKQRGCGPRLRRDPNTFSPNEVARMFGVTGEAVKQWIHRGLLRASKLPNGYWRIRHQDLARYLKFRQKLGPWPVATSVPNPRVDGTR